MSAAGSRAVLEWLARHEAQMLELLEAAVNIDSGSADKQGADRLGALLGSYLDSHGIATKRHPLERYGDCLSAEVPSAAGQDRAHVLLLGHMDTVFPAGTAARRPFRIDDGLARGPGVADMKAGLVMNVFVARAFSELGGNNAPVRLFFTADEEVASPASRDLTIGMARGAAAVFNAEPGRPTGNVVSGRKGAFFVDFEVKGVAAHAGVNPDKGASAIEAIARKIVELHQLADPHAGITSNIGTIKGGMSVNTVADHAEAQLDVRFPGGVDGEALRARIREIIERRTVPNTCACVKREGIFLPFEPSEQSTRLLEKYRSCAATLDMVVSGEFTGGSADSGLTASIGTATLCATGPVGGDVHTEREWLRVDTIVPRAQALALTILEL